MNWILAGLLMFVSSVMTYLLVRAAALRNISGALQNVFMFLMPLFVFVPLALLSESGLRVTAFQFVVLLVSAILFSYYGSRWSVSSIAKAPNPGYSLVLSKSYVVFTTIVAILVFGSEITFRAALSMLLIILFSAIIMIDPKKVNRQHTDTAWILYALGAFFCWGMLAIMSKYLLDIGVPIYTRLVYVIGIASILFLRDSWKEIRSVRVFGRRDWGICISMGLFSGAFNYFTQLGYVTAPNIGYINAINAASIALVTIGSSIVFHDEFSVRKFIGVIGVIFGLIVLVT